jgi:hypothetical protein
MEINNSRKVGGIANMPQSTSPKGGQHAGSSGQTQPMNSQNKLFLKNYVNEHNKMFQGVPSSNSGAGTQY